MLINKFQTILNKDKQKKNSINKVRTDKYIFIFIRIEIIKCSLKMAKIVFSHLKNEIMYHIAISA